MKMMLAGGPRVGKTKLAHDIARCWNLRVMHTDNLLTQGYDFGNISLPICEWMAQPGDWIIEGTMVPRAIRKWSRVVNLPLPIDRVLWLGTAAPLPQTPGQEVMARGIVTVWQQCLPVLEAQGIAVHQPTFRLREVPHAQGEEEGRQEKEPSEEVALQEA